MLCVVDNKVQVSDSYHKHNLMYIIQVIINKTNREKR